MTPDSWVVYPLLKSPLEMRNGFGTTPKSHFFTKVIPTLAADTTLSTRNADLEGHPVTYFEPGYKGPDSTDDTRGFVTER